MNKCVCVFLLLFIVGCDSGYSNYSPVYTYTGFSSHFKRTTGISNLTYRYKDPPVLDSNDPLDKSEFEYNAKDYLDGVVNDLKEVEDKADNAAKKIDAVVDAVNFGFEYFSVRYVGSVLTLSHKSNFNIMGYPEFPDFTYFPPQKPYKPLYLDNEFMVESYNASVRSYNKQIADFIATIKAYTEDAEHYIKNCKNDYEEIRQKGLNLSNHIESLDINAEVGLYRPRKTDEKIISNATPESKSNNKAETLISKKSITPTLKKCDKCGREIGKNETVCIFKTLIVCPDCFKRLSNK